MISIRGRAAAIAFAVLGALQITQSACTSEPVALGTGRTASATGAPARLSAGVPARAGPSADVAAPSTGPRVQIDSGSHNGPLRALALTPDQALVVTASDDKTARVWNAQTGALRHVLRPAIGAGALGRVYAIAPHPVDDLVAIAGTTGATRGSHKILFFRTSTGEFVRDFDAHGANIKRLAWAAGGSILLATFDGDHGMRAFDPDGQLLLEDVYRGASYGLTVSSDGKLAATTSLDGKIRVYQVSGRAITKRDSWQAPLSGPRGIAFSPDSSHLAVGYIGTVAKPGSPTVFDTNTGNVVQQLQRPQLTAGDLRIVAWSADATTVYAGGSAYLKEGEHAVYSFDVVAGRATAQPLVARNSITDLVRATDSSILFASFDGSWGRLQGNQTTLKVSADIADLRGPSGLRISDNARQVAFNFALGGRAAWFDLDRRLLTLGNPPAQLKSPATGSRTSDSWSNVRQAVVNGQPITLLPVEVSRSIAYLALSKDAVLGTSKALRRIARDGSELWRSATNAEVWSVNVSRDSRIVVTALSDGTIRWWRASDGELLMSLLMKADGRWALWTPQGYFDASERADRMIGWAVNRTDQPVADYFSLSRFRGRFNRPDVIDHLLDTADVTRAFDRAKADILATAVPGAKNTTRPVITQQAPQSAPASPASIKPVVKVQVVNDRDIKFTSIQKVAFPPVLRAKGPTVLRIRERVVTIPFAVQAQGTAQVQVRVNGKPDEQAQIRPPARFDGVAPANVTLAAPAPGAVVQVIAQDQNGVSEPLGFRIDIPANPQATKNTAMAPVPSVAGPVVFQPRPVDAAASVASAVAPAPQAPSVAPPAVAPAVPPADPAAVAQTATAPEPALVKQPLTPQQNVKRPAMSGLPRLFVLSIGVSDYKNADYQLGLPAKDARDFLGAIRRQQGRLYSAIEARLLDNQKATRAAVGQGLKWLRESVGPRDTGILFVAGHGLNGPTGQYFFLPWDANHERLDSTAVPESEIRNTLGKMRGRTIFFVDTCHAGAVGSFRTAKRELRKLANELAATENGVIVFASSSGRQLSEEKASWGNGAFTKAVIEGLNGKADFRNTGQVTFKSLDFYVSEEVKRLTDGRQTPVTNIPLGLPDFAVARLADA